MLIFNNRQFFRLIRTKSNRKFFDIRLSRILIFIFLFIGSNFIYAQPYKEYLPDYCMSSIDTALSAILMNRSDLTMRWDATGNDLHRLKNIKQLFANPLAAFALADTCASLGKYSFKDPLPFFLRVASLLDNSDEFSPEKPLLTNDKIKAATGIDFATLTFTEQSILRKFLVLAMYVDVQIGKNKFLLEEDKLKRVLNYCDSLLIHSEPDGKEPDLIQNRFEEREALAKAKKFFGQDAQGLDFGMLNEPGTILYLSSIETALNISKEIENIKNEDVKTRIWDTKFGKVAIGGKGDDIYVGNFFCIIDIGGNDIYKIGSRTKTDCYNFPTNLIVDFDGDDTYIGGDYTLGASIFGASTLIDLKGNDTYSANNFSLGCGFFSTNVLHDNEGNDKYSGGTCVEGCGIFGVGLLIDSKGNDVYNAHLQSQGFGYTRGFGAIIEAEGNDQYLANSPYTDFLRYDDHFETFCQGTSLGYRPVASGGYGFIFDYSGNDFYQADIYGQGAAYWYGLGGIVDYKGNDNYNAYQYAQGSGVHLAFGVLIDTSGNDNYFSHGVSQGCGHDIAFGGLYDAKGDDNYVVESLSLGGGNANAISLFLDGGGNDGYIARANNTMGYSDLRRDYGMIGLFIDLEGKDFYGSIKGANDSLWTGSYYGAGLDGAKLRPETAPPSVEKKPEKSKEQIQKELSDDIPILFIQASAAPQNSQYLVEPARAKLISNYNESFPYLLKNLNTDQPREALMLGIVIPKMGNRVIPYLMDTVRNGEKSRISRAVYILGEMKKDTAAEIIAERMLDSASNWRVRATCAEALMKINSPKVKEALLVALDDSIANVRAYALRAYLQNANRSELEYCLKFLNDPNQIVRYQYPIAMQKRGVDNLADFLFEAINKNINNLKAEILFTALKDLKNPTNRSIALTIAKKLKDPNRKIKELNEAWKQTSSAQPDEAKETKPKKKNKK